jgi:prepilin-type N-terminal cleavage/methylation domain-containing protein
MRRGIVRRLAREESGMSLIELLVVLIVIGILLMIAVPGYMGFRDRTTKSAAKSNLRNVLPAVALYNGDNSPNSRNDPNDGSPAAELGGGAANTTDSGFTGITPASLQANYDPTMDTTKYQISLVSSNDYCIYTWVSAWTAYKHGPSGTINTTLNSSFNPVTCS